MLESRLNPKEENEVVICSCCGNFIPHVNANFLCGDYYCDESCEPEQLPEFSEIDN